MTNDQQPLSTINQQKRQYSMFSPLERMIAMRYLRARKREGFISVIAGFSFVGIMLGVATLIVVMAVMNGFRAEITQKILGVNGHISVTSIYNSGIRDYEQIATSLQGVEQVTHATPLVSKQVMMTTESNTLGAMLQGIRKEDLQRKTLIIDNIISGFVDKFDEQGEDTIILGSHLAANLGVRVGDSIKVLSPTTNVTALGTLPRIKRYTVVALFEVGMYEFDNSVAYIPLSSAQVLFRYDHTVNMIEVMTADPDQSQLISGKILQTLEGEFIVQDWQILNASLFNALKVERTVMFLILTLIVCIAAFNIISSLIMLVNNKRKDIAILRTMGATRGMILRIFFMCGAMIGVVGTLAGLVLGVSFAANIETIRRWLESIIGHELFNPVLYFLSELPAKIETSDVVLSVGMGIVLSFLATIYPALKASRQEPVEVLRYE